MGCNLCVCARMCIFRLCGWLCVDEFPGSCKYHVDCLEGLANAAALAARAGVDRDQLHTVSDDHVVWVSVFSWNYV